MPNILEINTIKGTRQKTGNNTYGQFFPFGTDGQYIDMASGLDLEKELKLGGDHYVSVQELANNETKITENYTTINNNVDFYQVETSIKQTNQGTTLIKCQLYWVTDASSGDLGRILKKKKEIQISENGNITEIKEEIKA